jgi:hypothetical protein
MAWNNYSDYDLPRAILAGMAEVSVDYSEGGYVNVPKDRPIRFLFQFGEPKPSYADELMTDLTELAGTIVTSNLPSMPVVLTMDQGEADAVVTFHGDDVIKDGDIQLAYDLLWTDSPQQEAGGVFYVRCCDPSAH